MWNLVRDTIFQDEDFNKLERGQQKIILENLAKDPQYLHNTLTSLSKDYQVLDEKNKLNVLKQAQQTYEPEEATYGEIITALPSQTYETVKKASGGLQRAGMEFLESQTDSGFLRNYYGYMAERGAERSREADKTLTETTPYVSKETSPVKYYAQQVASSMAQQIPSMVGAVATLPVAGPVGAGS